MNYADFDDVDPDELEYSNSTSHSPPAYSHSNASVSQPKAGRFSPSNLHPNAYESGLERASALLAKNKPAAKPVLKEVEPETFSSLASNWLDGLNLGEDYEKVDNVMTAYVSVDSDRKDNEVDTPEREQERDFDRTMTSASVDSYDSFEMTSADFEVGTIATRLSIEKTAARASSAIPLKVVSSPDVTKV
jgi:hypothetical protein